MAIARGARARRGPSRIFIKGEGGCFDLRPVSRAELPGHEVDPFSWTTRDVRLIYGF